VKPVPLKTARFWFILAAIEDINMAEMQTCEFGALTVPINMRVGFCH
jgi:hypothetical protein